MFPVTSTFLSNAIRETKAQAHDELDHDDMCGAIMGLDMLAELIAGWMEACTKDFDRYEFMQACKHESEEL